MWQIEYNIVLVERMSLSHALSKNSIEEEMLHCNRSSGPGGSLEPPGRARRLPPCTPDKAWPPLLAKLPAPLGRTPGTLLTLGLSLCLHFVCMRWLPPEAEGGQLWGVTMKVVSCHLLAILRAKIHFWAKKILLF
ncbi:hypothetical protein HJG60_007995 [Phyllostomus discolor]|uniref:Uncharacterized protein n=1 Tax=Phyllostomus discolor TaxID=89673 RepID=A0A834BI06_9CHIR|nr:hypothetical protein HJG60_007995 [Phyllostomus discolor]